MAAIKGDKTVAKLTQQFDVHANQITQWKNQLLEHAGVVFEGSGQKEAPPIDIKALQIYTTTPISQFHHPPHSKSTVLD